jgi:SHS2 domain-containing protein
MPFRYLDDIAIADVAFEAWGESCAEMFVAAADALMNVMVADLATIRPEEVLEFRLEHEQLDLLLFDFLNELVFLKDARSLLLRITSLDMGAAGPVFTLSATVCGERPYPARHRLLVDVKAVTLHRFRVEETDSGWRAEVVLDI